MAVVRIESIAAGGDGVGRLDGLAVFVPRTAPGDLVEVDVRRAGRLGRGRLLRVLEPSPERVAARCSHYEADRCGGCQLQHLADHAQQEARRRIVRDAFARIARRDVDVPPPRVGPSPWAYRSRLTLALRFQGADVVMGQHAHDDPDRVFNLDECPITAPAVVDAWRAIRRAARLLPRARELRGTVRQAGDGLGFVLEGGRSWGAVRQFAEAVPALQLVRWRPDHGGARTLLDRRTARTPEESFDQVNGPVAAMARAELVARSLQGNPGTAIDAYAGLGAVAVALAERGVQVTAIEVDGAAARFLAGRLGPRGQVLGGRVEDVIQGVLPADVVILNPPRAGLHERVTQGLAASRPARVLYMSCDPATLARDVARLPGYRLVSLQPYDMFPQTAHVEVVCELTPEGS